MNTPLLRLLVPLLFVSALASGYAASMEGGWKVQGPGSLQDAPEGYLAVRYDSPDRAPVVLRPPKPIALPADATRLKIWFACVEGDSSLRFLISDGAGNIHTVDTTDSSMDGAAVQHDPKRRNEWSLWNIAESTSILAPSEAELRSRLRPTDVERIKSLLWPRPLMLTGIEVVPIQGPQKKKGTMYSGPRKKQIAAGSGLIWVRKPVWDTTFSRNADYYAYLKDRYRPNRDEPTVLFPDDLTPLKGQKNRCQVAIRRGYNGPWVWEKEGRLEVKRDDPASLFDQRIELPQLPVGRYVIDTKVWKPNGELAGTRQFTFWVGESKASLPAGIAPSFQLTTGSPLEVLPTGTTSAALKIMLGDKLPLGDGRQCRLQVMDYTGKTIVDRTMGADRVLSVDVPVAAGSDYFAEAQYLDGDKVKDQASLHFGVASPPWDQPKGKIPASIPDRDTFLNGHARLLSEYFKSSHTTDVYPFVQDFDFADFQKWAEQVRGLKCDTISLKAGWNNIEPLPGVFRWGIFDQEMDIARKAGLHVFIGYTPYGSTPWVPRWLDTLPFRDQFGDFEAKGGLVHPLAQEVVQGWHGYLRRLVTHFYTDPSVYGYIVFNTPLISDHTPEPIVTDYSQTAQAVFDQWLKSHGRKPAPLTPLLTIPGVRTSNQGPDLSQGWRDFVDFNSFTTYENTRRVLELLRGLDDRRMIFVDRKSNPYAVERITPLLKQYHAAFKNEGSPGFREAMTRSMTIQDGVPFVEELHRHVPTSHSLADASNYFASYLGNGAMWLLRWRAEMFDPQFKHPVFSLFDENYPFVRETQSQWDTYLSGAFYTPEVLVVGSRTDALLNGDRRGFFDDITGKNAYSALVEWQQVPAHFADEHSTWVDFSKFKLVFAMGEIMPQALIDKLAAAAKGGVHLVVVGDAGSIAAEDPGSTDVLKKALAELPNVKYVTPPDRIKRAKITSWDSPYNWKSEDVSEWLTWAGVERPVRVSADKQPGFQVQYRKAVDGTIYLAIMRNYYGWYRSNIEFEDELRAKYGSVAGTVTLPVPEGSWQVHKFHREAKDIGTFAAQGGAITFPIDPAVAGEVQLIRVRKQ